MNQYVTKLKRELAEYGAKCGYEGPDSILDFLWYCYSASNPVDDGKIKQTESALDPVFRELSVDSSDLLNNLICDLCTVYQRAAFLEGLLIGTHLAEELG